MTAGLLVGNANGVLQYSPASLPGEVLVARKERGERLPVCGLPWENARRPQPQRGCGEETLRFRRLNNAKDRIFILLFAPSKSLIFPPEYKNSYLD